MSHYNFSCYTDPLHWYSKQTTHSLYFLPPYQKWRKHTGRPPPPPPPPPHTLSILREQCSSIVHSLKHSVYEAPVKQTAVFSVTKIYISLFLSQPFLLIRCIFSFLQASFLNHTEIQKYFAVIGDQTNPDHLPFHFFLILYCLKFGNEWRSTREKYVCLLYITSLRSGRIKSYSY